MALMQNTRRSCSNTVSVSLSQVSSSYSLREDSLPSNFILLTRLLLVQLVP